MLATINTPKVQAPFGVSLLHLVLIIQGYNQNYMISLWRIATIAKEAGLKFLSRNYQFMLTLHA